MALNYSISMKNLVMIQGINVTISAEFTQGTLPEQIVVSASGQITTNDAQTEFMNLSASYNLAKSNFINCNGTNVPGGFIAEVETAILETYDQLQADKEGGAA